MRSLKVVRAGAVFAIALVAACSDDFTAAPAPERYVLFLTGAKERPNPITTTASASAVVTVVNKDSVEFTIYVSGADSITASHFHAGDANTAGPVMVFTFAGPTTGRFDGALRFGAIGRTTPFVGVFTFDSLMTRIRAGTTYLNIHTRKNPPGELRAQVVK